MDQRANLLFVSSYTNLGGGETALLNLVEHLDHKRFWPHLLTRSEGQLAQVWREHGWPVHITPWRGASVYFIPPVWARFPIGRRIEGISRDNQIHLIHSDYHTLPMALPAAERAGCPLVWWCWGWWFRPQFWQRGFFRRPAATFALSQAIKTGFLGSPPFMPPEQVELLYPGVDTARFHPDRDGLKLRSETGVDQDAPLVAMIARFQDVKGHDVFQEMARQVAQQIPEVRFMVAGENTQTNADDAYKTRILEVARTDPLLKTRLKYLGFRPDVEQVMAAADVIVCASHFESYGMVNVEAMASGKPVVSTNRGGPAETVAHNQTGFLVAPHDPAALAKYVIELLQDAQLRWRLGEAGRKRVEAMFSVESMVAQYTRRVEMLLKP